MTNARMLLRFRSRPCRTRMPASHLACLRRYAMDAKEMIGFFSGEESWDYHRCLQDEFLLVERRFKTKQKAPDKTLKANDMVEDTGSAVASASSYAQAGRMKLAANRLEEKLREKEKEAPPKSSGGDKKSKGASKGPASGGKKSAKKEDAGAGEAAAAATKKKRASRMGGCEEYCIFAVVHRNALIHE